MAVNGDLEKLFSLVSAEEHHQIMESSHAEEYCVKGHSKGVTQVTSGPISEMPAQKLSVVGHLGTVYNLCTFFQL